RPHRLVHGLVGRGPRGPGRLVLGGQHLVAGWAGAVGAAPHLPPRTLPPGPVHARSLLLGHPRSRTPASQNVTTAPTRGATSGPDPWEDRCHVALADRGGVPRAGTRRDSRGLSGRRVRHL